MPTYPDFMIIGAMKCGTSTLQAQLSAQPGIFMTTPKEPNFFSDDDVFARGEAWYDSLFDGAGPGDLTGEASTHYTKLPDHPHTLSRMSARLEAPKLIYMMRDPLDRAISHYIHEWTMGVVGNDPVQAFEAHPEMIDYSRYGMQIAPFVERYGREAIHLIRLERMHADPQGTLDRLGPFLGRDGLIWNPEIRDRNVSSERMRRVPLQGLLIDNALVTRLRHALVPKPVRRWVRRSRQMRERPVLPEAFAAHLAQVFAEDQARLRALFPGDPALAPLPDGQ